MTSAPCRFAGLSLDRTRLMGVVNVTPDSFSDGGEVLAPEAAVARGLAMLADGADIIDVGGESTRPGALPVPMEEERDRVVPVVRALSRAGALVSIDTRRLGVMQAAIDAGARIVNDVTALGSEGSMAFVARSGASAVLMHMRGEPRTMQHDPQYDDPAAEISDWLTARAAACVRAGIPADRIAVDPGIGFGKTLAHNLAILTDLGRYRDLPHALVIGVSRKSLIAALDHNVPPKQRLAGSLAAAIACVQAGAHIIRVHDVGETRQALAVYRALTAPGASLPRSG
jgi:dihydropteroate synthase